jgi:predicted AlkP superfamily phosphohydrolase/phosphomutase
MRPRVLVIALAEATFELLLPLAKAGKLPTFSRLMSGGAWGHLQSQMPMVTPQICGTVVTGRSPGQHGLLDFFQRGPDGRFRETNGTDLKAPPIWRMLSQQGFRCAILNVPFTYPPEKINGFVIAGEDAPGAHPSIAYPPELFKKVTEQFGPYPLKDTFPGGRERSDYLTVISDDARRQSEIFAHLLKSNEWDFALTFFSHTAMVQHYFWADHASGDAANPFRGVIESAYTALDSAVDRLCQAAGDGATVFVISDAGAGPLRSGVNINQFLEQQGFLKQKVRSKSGAGSSSGQPGLIEKLRQTAQGLLRRESFKSLYFAVNHYMHPLKLWVQSQLSGRNIDWSQTQAYSRGQWGYIYVNLKGRDPKGIVSPGAEYEKVRSRIIDAFSTLVDPATGDRAATRVWRREEIYEGPWVDWAPDLVIDWRDGAYMPNEASRSDSVFGPRQREYMSWPTTGSHRLNGILIAAGPGIAPGIEVNGARIIDLVPTWLSIFGQRIPRELEGKTILQLFSERLAS